jgi:hypothetical protein
LCLSSHTFELSWKNIILIFYGWEIFWRMESEWHSVNVCIKYMDAFFKLMIQVLKWQC